MAIPKEVVGGAASGAASGMALGPLGAAIGGGLGLISGFLGAGAQDRAQAEANARYNAQRARLDSIAIPQAEELRLQLQQYLSAGEYNPELEQALSLGPSAMQQVQTDPRLVQHQQRNLEALQQIADSGGFDPSVKADLNQGLRRLMQDKTAQAQALQQQAQMRGVSDSGVALAQQLLAGQSGANQEAEMMERLAAQAYQNRRGALGDASELAAQLRQQGFSEQQAKAMATDAIDKFNVSMASDVNQRNVGNKNLAQQYNLAQKQRIMDSNVDISNRQQAHNQAVNQTMFENKLRKEGLLSDSDTKMANMALNQGQREADKYAGAAGAIGSGLNAYLQYKHLKR